MDVIEVSERFPTELSCIEYAEDIRYGKLIKCAYCGSDNLSKRSSDYRHKCINCNRSTSVTIGTNIHNTRLPLKTWFFAISIITDAKKGLSALQLQRHLNVSYPTAFSMYHKLRSLMAFENKAISDLEGIVEMDETYIGGKPRKFADSSIDPEKRENLDFQIDILNDEGYDFTPNGKNRSIFNGRSKRGRGTNAIPVVGIIERNGNVIAEVMRTLSNNNLKSMVQKYVKEENSVLITDSFSGYNSMKQIIDHIKIDHKKLYSYRGVNSNSIESFWAIIERGIMGQYHSVSPKMLPNYVAEFVYKYNNRDNNEHIFNTLTQNLFKPIN